MSYIEVRNATPTDIPIIEDILLDAVIWLDSNQLHLWAVNEVSWSSLNKKYSITDFFIASLDGVDIGCMVLIDYDPFLWPEVPKGSSLFLHKLAVKRIAAGKGISTVLIDYAKQACLNNGIKQLRLDCHQHRIKLRNMYENNGFICVAEKRVLDKYNTAFYLYDC